MNIYFTYMYLDTQHMNIGFLFYIYAQNRKHTYILYVTICIQFYWISGMYLKQLHTVYNLYIHKDTTYY